MQLDNPILYFVKLYYYHMAVNRNSGALKIEKSAVYTNNWSSVTKKVFFSNKQNRAIASSGVFKLHSVMPLFKKF